MELESGMDEIFGEAMKWFDMREKDETPFVLRYLDCDRDCYMLPKNLFLFFLGT